MPTNMASRVEIKVSKDLLIRYVLIKNSIRREMTPNKMYNAKNRNLYTNELKRVSSIGLKKIIHFIFCP